MNFKRSNFKRSKRACRDAMIRRRRHADAIRIMYVKKCYRDAARYYRDANAAVVTAETVSKVANKVAKMTPPGTDVEAIKQIDKVSREFAKGQKSFVDYLKAFGMWLRAIPGKVKNLFLRLYHKLKQLFGSMKKTENSPAPIVTSGPGAEGYEYAAKAVPSY